jgi:hypothetical protein
MKSIRTISVVLILIAVCEFNSVPYVEGCDHMTSTSKTNPSEKFQ